MVFEAATLSRNKMIAVCGRSSFVELNFHVNLQITLRNILVIVWLTHCLWLSFIVVILCNTRFLLIETINTSLL